MGIRLRRYGTRDSQREAAEVVPGVMALLGRLFRKGGSPPREHPLFGTLRYSKHDGWENEDFSLWDFKGIQLLIDAGTDGPSPRQEEAFRRFEAGRGELLPRCLRALDSVRESFEVPEGEFRVTGLSIPSLGPGRGGDLWTLWFDLEGDDHFMYGVQSDNDWETLAAFADD